MTELEALRWIEAIEAHEADLYAELTRVGPAWMVYLIDVNTLLPKFRASHHRLCDALCLLRSRYESG